MAWADTIEEIKTVCWCGRKATFNTRVFNGKVVKEGEQIMLGGNESYVALCRRHWASGQLAPLEVRKVTSNKKKYLPMLLDADPSEAMIDRYLDAGEMYVLLIDGQTVAEAVVLQKDANTCELCNLATAPEHQHKGYASTLVKRLQKLYKPRCRTMLVGTSPANTGFYENLGFIPTSIRPNFFKDNYPEPIYENGAPLTDMHVLSIAL